MLLDDAPVIAHPDLPDLDRHLMAWLDRRPDGMTDPITDARTFKIQDDPEAMFQVGWLLCDVGKHEAGLALFSARRREGLLRRPDAARSAAVRRAAERSGFPRAGRGGGSRPRGRSPHFARPAETARRERA